ncbi:MAG: SDR family oxidoreductase [Roseiarcus sp.]|jgi:NAD(P)-dependent dehydrogenase (short-subunit alcohol dehydrogenase family)
MADVRAKTIVVTGASSGIGKATAKLFRDRGWNVAATMRNPSAERDLAESAALKLIALDVQDPEAPRAAVAAALEAFGRIDVWVNNAGYGAFGPVEAGSREQIARQFDVNVFGLIACVQAAAPHFRANRAGVLINVSSIGGLMTMPSFAVYNASKFAVEGLSEGLWYELGAFGIKVKVVEPGAIATDFGGRSLDAWDASAFPDYAAFMEKVNRTRESYVKNASPPERVAEVVYQAATDPSDRMRYLAGADARRVVPLRRLLGSRLQMRMIKRIFKI